MTPEQEKKFHKWVIKNGDRTDFFIKELELTKDAWQACLEANGIKENNKTEVDVDYVSSYFQVNLERSVKETSHRFAEHYNLKKTLEKEAIERDRACIVSEYEKVHGKSEVLHSTADSNHSATDWVINMMKTGKPVKCLAWDMPDDKKQEILITGYDSKGSARYLGTNGWWRFAEPITEWKPQIGDAVFARYKNKEDRYITVTGRVYKIRDDWWYHIKCVDDFNVLTGMEHIKPFNASKIGKPWGEI